MLITCTVSIFFELICVDVAGAPVVTEMERTSLPAPPSSESPAVIVGVVVDAAASIAWKMSGPEPPVNLLPESAPVVSGLV